MADKKPKEPGEVADLNHGLPGEPEDLFERDADYAEETEINDDEDTEEDD